VVRNFQYFECKIQILQSQGTTIQISIAVQGSENPHMLRTIKSNIWLSGDVLYSITLSDQPFPKPIGRMKNYQTYFKMPCF